MSSVSGSRRKRRDIANRMNMYEGTVLKDIPDDVSLINPELRAMVRRYKDHWVSA